MPERRTLIAVGAIVYVSLVLLLDTFLAQRGIRVTPAVTMNLLADMLGLKPISFGSPGQWLPRIVQHVDALKTFLWLILPLGIVWVGMDWEQLTFRTWKRIDYLLLLGLAGVGIIVVLVIPLLPGVREVYASGRLPASWDRRVLFIVAQLVWTFSWLPGWEFLHRYFLLRPSVARWPRYGWLLVPLSEGLYHLQKPMLETVGMVAFSILATQYTLRRGNVLLPFLAHLIIEIELILFMALR
jgi:CAAX prenyl protease-like protein